MRVDKKTLQSMITEVRAFRPVPISGYMANQVRTYGLYQEPGLTITPEDLHAGHLYAGLSVLARDMHQYLAENPRPDAEQFKDVVDKVHSLEKKLYDLKAFPDYKTLPAEGLPRGMAASAASGEPRLKVLGQPEIVHEWTLKPGKKLLKCFVQALGPAFLEILCAEDGPYGKLTRRSVRKSAAALQITQRILATLESEDPFWAPWAVYSSVLLVERGLKPLCEGEDY